LHTFWAMVNRYVIVGALLCLADVPTVGFSPSPLKTCKGLQSTALRSTSSWLDQQLRGLSDLVRGVVGGQPEGEIAFESGEKQKMKEDEEDSKNSDKKTGRVVRLAARRYDPVSSKPSSPHYTTRKDPFSTVMVSQEGVMGDYNQYRTEALNSIPTRAVSILTTDAMNFVRSLHPTSQDGDLGENIFVDGLGFSTLKVGETYRIGDSVVVTITEPIEPCARLCKLPYINDPSLNPRARVVRCNTFLDQLDKRDGMRGWYGRVLQPGSIKIGDSFEAQ